MSDNDRAPHAVLGGRYRLERRIGRGGMADVYLATDELLHRTVAIKLFRPGVDDGAAAQRIDSEMRTLAGLRHPGLVTLYDAGIGDESTGATPYLVMEWVAGGSLRSRLDQGPVSLEAAAAVGRSLAAALAYVHEQGLVHRDVKPANVLLDRPDDQLDPGPRLADFGLAQLVGGTRMTLDGTTVGTANYLSPEQARGDSVGPPTDVYALGLLVLECLTGRIAYDGSGIEAAVARLNRAPYIPPSLGPGWISLLTAMTQFDPAQRPSMNEVVSRIAAVAPSAPTQLIATAADHEATAALATVGATSVLPAADAPRPRRDRRFLWLWFAVPVLALIIGVSVAALSDGGNAAPDTVPTRTHGTSNTPRATHSSASTRASSRPSSVSVRTTTHSSASARPGRRDHKKHKNKHKKTGGGPAAPPGGPGGGKGPAGPGKGPGPG